MTTDPTSHPAGRGDVYGRKMSSSADLSSPPPKSPESPFEEDAIVVYSGPPVIPMGSTTTATITSSSSVPKIEAPAKPKRIRKPRLAPDGTEIKPKPRKSRAKKKDPEPTLSEPMIPAPSLETAENRPQTPTQNTSKSSRQSRINELMNSVGNNVIVTRNQNPEPIIKTDDPIGTKSEAIPTLSDMSEILVNTDRSPSIQHHQQPTSHTTLPTSSRGQNYDPIRSSTITAQRSVLITNSSTPPVQVSPIKSVTRATASPSIASLINPPSDPVLNNPKSSFPPAQPLPAQLTPAQLTQSFQTLQDSPIIIQAPIPMPLVKQPAIPMESIDSMDIDPKPTTNSRKTSASAASATSPHPTKQKDKPSGVTPKLPPLPGQGYANSKVSGARAIVINVPLNGARNQYVNFQQLAVQKYGCDVVWPKLALQRDHLARVAANAAALERKPGVTTSNDDMSIDGSDNEAELSAGSKRKVPAGIEEQPAKKKRLTYEDMYDKDDPFVDDTEMAWEEQAAAVKDGFFVYSGLLVPAGGEANVEKYDSLFFYTSTYLLADLI